MRAVARLSDPAAASASERSTYGAAASAASEPSNESGADAEPQPGARSDAQARPREGHLDVIPGRGPHAPVGRIRCPGPIPRAGGGAALVGEIAVGVDQEMKGAGADRGRRSRRGV